MLTFKAEVLKSKQKSDGTYNVKIRMTYNREVKRLSTNIFVRQEDLTKSFKLKNPKFIKEADAIVRYYQETCAKLQLDINRYTLDDILIHLKVARMNECPRERLCKVRPGWQFGCLFVERLYGASCREEGGVTFDNFEIPWR